MLLTAETQANMVMDIMANKWHLPIVKGKSDRDNIEDNIIAGMYARVLPPMEQDDVDMIISLVDEMVTEFTKDVDK